MQISQQQVPLQIYTPVHVNRGAVVAGKFQHPVFTGASETQESQGFLDKLKQWGRRILITTTIFTGGFVSGRMTGTYTPPIPTVVSVHDGDTFKMSDGRSIRLYGADAPELAQPLGPEAQARLEKMILGKPIETKGKGSNHGRPVCLVYVDGKEVNKDMVTSGYAFSEIKYAKDPYHDQEADARSHKRGVWKFPGGGERPDVYRERVKKPHSAK